MLTNPEPVPLPVCDCLNYCGDDPRVQDGRAQGCAFKLEQNLRAAQLVVRMSEAARLAELQVRIATTAARRTVENSGTEHWINGKLWYDRQRCQGAETADAFDYLLLAGEATAHATHNHLVQLRYPKLSRPARAAR